MLSLPRDSGPHAWVQGASGNEIAPSPRQPCVHRTHRQLPTLPPQSPVTSAPLSVQLTTRTRTRSHTHTRTQASTSVG